MALDTWWFGHRTETVQKVVVRCNANDTVIVNGSTQTADTSTLDGTLVFDGAPGGGSITVNGSVAATYPATPYASGDFEIAFGSCQTPQLDDVYGHLLCGPHHNPAIFFHAGDYIYETNTEATKWVDFSITSLEADATLANFYAHKRAIRFMPGFKKLMQKIPMEMIADDHDWFDPWDNTDPGTGVSGTGVAIDWLVANEGGTRGDNLTVLRNRIIDANKSYMYRGCPDPDTRYYSFVRGNTKFICLDLMAERSAISAVDNASKTMLGATQKAWFKAEVSTGETFKVIISSKTTTLDWSNPDSWNVYTTELIELQKYIDDNSVTGVIWVGGDHHHPCVVRYAAGELQASPAVPATGSELICINASPVGRQQDHDVPWTEPSIGAQALPTGCEWRYDYTGGVGTNSEGDACFGKLLIRSSYIEAQIWRINNKMIWAGRLYAGESKLKKTTDYMAVAI